MHISEATVLELGLLEDLDLVDMDILEGMEEGGLALNILLDGSSDEFLDDRLQIRASNLTSNVLDHTSADSSDLGGLGVGGLSDLVSITLRECNAEDTEEISIASTDGQGSFNLCMPLADNGAQLVTGERHTVEVRETFTSLDIFANETELLEVSVDTVKISKGDFVDTSLKVVTSNT